MTIPITFNDQYLNQTVNKDLRGPNEPYLIRCWHETANGSGDAHSTLKWNLKATQRVGTKTYDVYSSYDVLVARDGTPYRYVDWNVWNSWSEGVSSAMINGTMYRDNLLGRRAFGIELDGPNNGIKATSAQIETAARLVLFTEDTLHIPADGKHDFTHAQIAPNRKTDPQGYTVKEVLDAAAALRGTATPDYSALWGTHYPYFAESGIAGAWRDNAAALGPATSDETGDAEGKIWRLFRGGAVSWNPRTGKTVVYTPRKP